jgi:hypothetical protein
LSVAAGNATRFYGDANPLFDGTITGVKNGDAITATYASVDATNPVGTYAITPTLVDPAGRLGNYTVTSSNGTLTITPAPLSVSAANASRAYGDPNPVFTGTITGLKNGDAITSSFASAATAASNIGTYPIVSTLSDPTAKLGNYTVTSNNGVLTVTAAPLSVSAANASRIYGDANPAFTGTITGLKNGDAVTATFASAATAASNVGSYPIVPTLADPAGKLANYAVTTSNGTLTVTPASLSVSAVDATRVYGDPNPAFTGTITGLKNADNITATFASAATAASNVGTYPIIATLADPAGKLGNYTVVSNNGTLTVTKAPLTVSAANATRLYGDANPVFAGTLTGLKNGDNITASYASVDVTAAVGTYSITPTLVDPAGKLGNYSVTSSNGTLTITPASLSVTAANATRVYGDANPAFTGTITGLKNGDNITATFSSVATAASAVGTYPITATLADATAKLGNYSVTNTSGTLTISPVALTVTVANATRAYGDPNPIFTGTITGLKNGDVITATFGTAADVTTAAGTYPIVATLADPAGRLGNYTVINNNGVLTITRVPLTVAAAGATRLFGQPNPAFTGTITGLKNADNITANFTTTATQTSPVGSYPIVPVLVDPQGKLASYNVVIKNGNLAVRSVTTAVSVLPNAGTARTQSFQFNYSDPAGFAAITATRVLFSPAVNFTGSCALLYTAATHTLAAVNDNGIGFGAAGQIGTVGSVQNSQCSIDLASASAIGSGNNLSLNVTITFKATFTGTKNIFLYAENKFALNSGYQSRGSWALTPLPPTTVSASPTGGNARNQVFQLTYSDPSGAGSITATRVLFSPGLSFANSCAVLYTAATQSLAIVNDNGVGWGPAGKIGTAGTLQNTQCSLNLATSSVSTAGTNLTLSLDLTFKPVFVGTKSIFLYAENRFGKLSGYDNRGSWTLSPLPPAPVSVSPSGGTARTQLFQLTYADPSGAASITATRLLFSPTVSFANNCAVLYTPATHTLAVVNDNGIGWGPAGVLGTAGTVQNSKCSVDLASSSVIASGTDVTLNVAITFNATYVGTKNIFLYAENKFGLNSGYHNLGSWILP